jgi:hypothetical protein
MSYQEDRNPFFEVKREKLFTESGLDTDKWALINDETSDILGIVSDGYKMVENARVNTLFEEVVEGLEIAEVHDHMDSITKKWRRRIIFSQDSLTYEVKPGDEIKVMLEIFNGYDARTAYGYELMGFRSACSNGMVTGKQSIFREVYSHFQDNIDEMRNMFETRVDAFQRNIDIWKKWSEIPFSTSDFEKFIEDRKYLGSRVKKSLVDSYEPLLEAQKLDDTKYGAFNVLTYIGTHETKARAGSNVFSAGHRNINRAASDLFDNEEELYLIEG